MEQYSNADVCVSAACSVLISNGEHKSAAQLRGLEVFTQEDALLALNAIRMIKPQSMESRSACATALVALMQAIKTPAAA